MKANRMMWIFICLATLYLSFLALVYFSQSRMMFFPSPRLPAPAQIGLSGFKEINLTAEDGIRLVAWLHASKDAQKAIVFFYGNADSLGNYPAFLKTFARAGYTVLGVNYRGYGGSEGVPNEQGLYKDGRAAMKFLSLYVKPENIVVVGRSIGSGVAVQMAKEFDAGGLALISPFTSIVDIASKIYWYFPVNLLTRNRFESLVKLKDYAKPVLIIHGDVDTLIPLSHSERLMEALSARKELAIYKGGDHNDLDPQRMAEDIVRFFKE